MRIAGMALLYALGALAFDTQERALLDLVDQGKFIRAREEADALVTGGRASFATSWSLARIFHDEEGNHARALYFVRDAEVRLGESDAAWGRRLLLEEYFILQEMNRNEEALAVLDRFSERYGPAPPSLRIWPLFKSGRSAEAMSIARKLAQSRNLQDRSEGYNGLLSIAFEQHDRQGTYDWAVAGVKATDGLSCTILQNAGSSALTRFRVDEAQGYLLRSRDKSDCVAPIGNQLSAFALTLGEFQKSIAALKAAQAEPIESRYRAQFALSRRTLYADLLVALGREHEAARVALELLDLQTRTGMTSSAADIERLARVMRAAFAVRGEMTRTMEEASYASRTGWLRRMAFSMPLLTARAWELNRGLRQLVVREDRMTLMLRPYLGEITDWANWRLPDLLPVVGAGVLRRALARARTSDAAFPEAGAYADAIEGEIAHYRGNWHDAARLAAQALAALSPREQMIRWRVAAYRADALQKSGQLSQARPLYQEVLSQWPTILRLLDLRLPVQVVSSGGAAVDALRDRLARSSRFMVTERAPFIASAEAVPNGFQICLRDVEGNQFACAQKPTADEVLDAFHAAAFSPRLSMSQSDFNGIDGSPTRVGTADVLKQFLEPLQ